MLGQLLENKLRYKLTKWLATALQVCKSAGNFLIVADRQTACSLIYQL